MKTALIHRLVAVGLFGMAFGFVEGAVVVYLRAVYYPEGFGFPLKEGSLAHLGVELAREAATLVMLAAIAYLAGRKRWERFGYFLVAFGVWDVFYYVWLKVMIDWPATLFDWDVLFLMPLPWIGPVIAPIAIAAVMITTGGVLISRLARNLPFHPSLFAWTLSLVGVATILFSFMGDTDATLRGGTPREYHYELLGIGVLLGIAAFFLSCRTLAGRNVRPPDEGDQPPRPFV